MVDPVFCVVDVEFRFDDAEVGFRLDFEPATVVGLVFEPVAGGFEVAARAFEVEDGEFEVVAAVAAGGGFADVSA